jgi:hypothetical protein
MGRTPSQLALARTGWAIFSALCVRVVAASVGSRQSELRTTVLAMEEALNGTIGQAPSGLLSLLYAYPQYMLGLELVVIASFMAGHW